MISKKNDRGQGPFSGSPDLKMDSIFYAFYATNAPQSGEDQTQ